jgi:MFS family permease
MGIVSDKFGRKIILIPSFLIMGLTSLLIALTQNDIFLAIIIGILGIFFYPILNLNQIAIMDVADKHIHASSMGITSLIMWPAVLISPVLAGLLVDTFNIEIAFIYAGIIALSAALIILPVKFRILPLK